MLASSWTQAFVFGALSAMSLPIGAMIGVWLRPSVWLTAAVMAFGAGALLAAMSFELVLPALEKAGFLPLALGFSGGCLLFVWLNHVLNVKGAFLRKAATLGEYARGVKRRLVEDTIRELSRVDILRSLPPEEVQGIVSFVSHVHLHAGDIVFDQGDPGDALYIVDEGKVAIMRTDRGATQTLAHLSSGQTFGEMALLTEKTRMASAIAVEPVTLWKIHKDDFDRMIEGSELLRSAVNELMVERRARTEALITAEEWRARAMHTLDREALQPTNLDVQDVIHQARARGQAGFAIWLGSALDGVGESVVIGASTLGAAVSMPLVGGVFISNLPEAMASASTLRRQRMPGAVIFWMWASLVLLSGVCAALGNLLLAQAGPAGFAAVEGMAAGAILAMIAQTMLPEAFEGGGGVAVAVMTAAGFLAAIFVGILTGA